MHFEYEDVPEKIQKMLSVRVAVARIRKTLGSYSNFSLTQDIGVLATSGNPLQHVAQEYLKKPSRGISPELIRAIIEKRPNKAPDGYLGMYRASEETGCSFDVFKERLAEYLVECDISPDMLSNRAAWEKEKDTLTPLFVHGRANNGATSVFFSPLFLEGMSNYFTYSRNPTLPQESAPAVPRDLLRLHVPEAENIVANGVWQNARTRLIEKLEKIVPDLDVSDAEEARALIRKIDLANKVTHQQAHAFVERVQHFENAL